MPFGEIASNYTRSVARMEVTMQSICWYIHGKVGSKFDDTIVGVFHETCIDAFT